MVGGIGEWSVVGGGDWSVVGGNWCMVGYCWSVDGAVPQSVVWVGEWESLGSAVISWSCCGWLSGFLSSFFSGLDSDDASGQEEKGNEVFHGVHGDSLLVLALAKREKSEKSSS